MSVWYPIETAPDNKLILVWCCLNKDEPGAVFTACHDPDSSEWLTEFPDCYDGVAVLVHDPEYWMPMPEEPR